MKKILPSHGRRNYNRTSTFMQDQPRIPHPRYNGTSTIPRHQRCGDAVLREANEPKSIKCYDLNDETQEKENRAYDEGAWLEATFAKERRGLDR